MAAERFGAVVKRKEKNNRYRHNSGGQHGKCLKNIAGRNISQDIVSIFPQSPAFVEGRDMIDDDYLQLTITQAKAGEVLRTKSNASLETRDPSRT